MVVEITAVISQQNCHAPTGLTVLHVVLTKGYRKHVADDCDYSEEPFVGPRLIEVVEVRAAHGLSLIHI